MRIALLAYNNNRFRQALLEVLAAEGHTVDLYEGDFLETTSLDSYELVILKTKQPKFLAAAYRAKGHGVKVIPDPVIAEEVRNRVLRERILSMMNVNFPLSVYDYSDRIRKRVPSDFFPAVTKPLMSSGAIGLSLVKTSDELIGIHHDGPIYAQKFMEGRHFVVYIIGDNTYAFEKDPQIGADYNVRQIESWHDLQEIGISFNRITGLLWGKLDIVLVGSETQIVDMGVFPSFEHLAQTSEMIAKRIYWLMKQQLNIECRSLHKELIGGKQ